MKCSSKRVNLIWLSLLWIFWIVWFINLTNGTSLTQIVPPWAESGHVVRLYSLFLWENTTTPNPDSVSMTVNTGENFLEMQGWLVVWSGNTVDNGADSAVIWGWFGNTISGTNVWILGWKKNTVRGKNSLIGGWFGNVVNAQNAEIWGWSGNEVSASNGVIIWWYKNQVDGENGVVLWGQSNKAKWKNSLVGWYGAEWGTWSFAWRAKAKENTARIDVNSGMLIWTINPINGVRLVVSWAVSLSKFKEKDNMWTTWEIRVVSWCIYAYDGNNWQVMGKASRLSCEWTANVCRFWEIPLFQWEQADAYKNFCSISCSDSSNKVKVKCLDWDLVDSSNNKTGTYYPYCYNVWA